MDSLRHAPRLTPEDVLKVLPGMFWDHDCVMLPGLGGFVCNPRSARYDEAKRQIVPPSRDVLFNPRLTTNDGVVANELMAKHGLAYGEALKAVEPWSITCWPAWTRARRWSSRARKTLPGGGPTAAVHGRRGV